MRGVILLLCSVQLILGDVSVDLDGLGTLIGTTLLTRENRVINTYRGIPYAEAPIEKNRFKAPVTKVWSGTFIASEYGNTCVQPPDGSGEVDRFYWSRKDFDAIFTSGDEDCLNLNVYHPANVTGPLPVLMFVHGGGFISGSSKYFSPEYMLDRDIVLVTVQYRLGPLGFLSLQNEFVPGNAGILDVVEALRWINKHINKFNGDPQKVTVFGQSAGAAMVSYLLISPLTEGLIHGVIGDSGSSISPWAIDLNPMQSGLRIAELAGCNNDSATEEEIGMCLEEVSIKDLMLAFYKHTAAERFQGAGMTLGGTVPVVSRPDEPEETKAVPDDPVKLLERGDYKPLPLLTGSNRHDAIFLVDLMYWIYLWPLNRTSDADYMRYEYPQMVVQVSGTQDPSEFVTDMFESKYLKNVPYEDRDDFSKMKYGTLDYITTLAFKAPGLRCIELNSLQGAASYLYTFDYKGQYNGVGDFSVFETGVTHSDELTYLTPRYGNFTEDELKFSKMMVNLWANFASSGDPNVPVATGSVNWPKFVRGSEQYLMIDGSPNVKSNYHAEFMAAVADTSGAAALHCCIIVVLLIAGCLHNLY